MKSIDLTDYHLNTNNSPTSLIIMSWMYLSLVNNIDTDYCYFKALLQQLSFENSFISRIPVLLKKDYAILKEKTVL